MKANQGVFLASRVVFGTGHLVFQSLADACMNAEAKVIEKVGYWEDNKQYDLTPFQLAQYKAQRKLDTKKKQQKVMSQYDKMALLISKKKQLV